ncbi:MAG: FAD binding domain-containing protein [Myxococcales bacterium]|nr:FAD binding domain-containing protein [Myxococcales bacterium]
MTEIQFLLNNREIKTSQSPGLVLLDFIREQQRLTGTKIGCREGDCGACSVLLGTPTETGIRYLPITSCLFPLGRAHGCHVVTVEGLRGQDLTPVQRAMVQNSGSQCGFCTPGFVMSMTGLALEESDIYAEDPRDAINGNICRCTGYKSIERALTDVVEILKQKPQGSEQMAWLIEQGFVPSYFATVAQRLQAIAPRSAASEGKSIILGGGSDLNVQRPEEIRDAEVRFAQDTAEHDIYEEGDYLYIGGAATMEDINRSSLVAQYIPSIHQFMKLVASTPIRTIASIAGNLINASPIGDVTILMLAMRAEIELVKQDARRWLPLEDLYLGYKTLAKEDGELFMRLRFPKTTEHSRTNFEKVSKRTFLDIASVNSAMRLEVKDDVIQEARLSAGGVAPIPKFLQKTSAWLVGQPLTWETARQAAEHAQQEVSPISDVRGSADYKRLLLRQLIVAHFAEATALSAVKEDLVSTTHP